MEDQTILERPVFVAVTSRGCEFCKSFRANWEEIQDAIKKTGLVRIVDIEVNRNNEKPDITRYPRDLHRYLAWYPTFCLFRGRSWDSALPTHSTDTSGAVIHGIIYNGQVTPRKAEMIKGPPPTLDNILHWIRVNAPNLTDIVSRGNAFALPSEAKGLTGQNEGATTGDIMTMLSASAPSGSPASPPPVGNPPDRRYPADPLMVGSPSGSLSKSSVPHLFVPTAGSNQNRGPGVCQMRLRPRKS